MPFRAGRDHAQVQSRLHAFGGFIVDLAAPSYGALARDSVGNLYGSTIGGGSQDVGTIFKLAPDGKETILANLGHF